MADDPDRAYHQVLASAYRIAALEHERCRPVHLLAALAEGDGPIAEGLTPSTGDSPFPRTDPVPASWGGGASYLVVQTQQAARRVASERNQPVGAEHLLLAILDQAEPEAIALLTTAGLDTTALRAVALDLIEAPADLPPIPMPPLVAAGTMDRPPLPIEQLDRRAWTALCWRQEHLPLRHVRRHSNYESLQHLEFRAAWRIASRCRLDDDQRYSLVRHHHDQVEELSAQAKPDLVQRRTGKPRPPTALSSQIRLLPRGRRWRSKRPGFTIGWGTWFGNRLVGLRDGWFKTRTLLDYRGAPHL